MRPQTATETNNKMSTSVNSPARPLHPVQESVSSDHHHVSSFRSAHSKHGLAPRRLANVVLVLVACPHPS